MRTTVVCIALGLSIACAAPALAQRLPFERTFEMAGASTLDVSTIRGKIEVTAGDPGRVVVAGAVTVRTGMTVPSSAFEIARKVAANPPIERDGSTIRLRPPAADDERRAVTVSYQVRVPPETHVITVSDSGATTIRGVSGSVVVRTHSAAIDLGRLGGTADVTTGSGAVNIDGVAQALTVETSSSAVTGRSLQGAVRVRTGSGAVDADLAGSGDVDVETGSSEIRLRGVKGALTASTRSGAVSVDGEPGRPWSVTTGSSAVALDLAQAGALTLDASSGSGQVKVEGGPVQGSTSKKKVSGTVGTGGPLVKVSSRSGSIRVKLAGTY